jgi:phage N-6-adenine-methyltransferase
MSLVGFKAKNHPQQRTDDDVDDRATTAEMFGPLDRRFGFTVDVAAAAHNTKCPRFYDLAANGLEQDWDNEVVWCNPPYSNLEPWLDKAWRSAATVVMLLPANRCEQPWWQTFVEPYRDRGLGLTVEFLPGRPRFIKPGDSNVKANARPPFGCCLLIWEGHEPGQRGAQGKLDLAGRQVDEQ